MNINRLILIVIVWLSGALAAHGAEWCVQVSTYRHLEGIRQDYRKVKDRHEARIEKIGGIYSLRTGFYESEGQAREALKSIREQFPKAIARTCADIPERVIESSKPLKVKGKRKDSAVDKTGSRKGKTESEQTASLPPPGKSQQAPSPEPFRHTMRPVVAPEASPPEKMPKQAPSTQAEKPPPEAVPSVSEEVKPPPPPSGPQDIFAEAERQRGQGQYTQAIALYQKAAEQSPPESDLAGRAAYRIALCRDAIGEKRMAEADYAQAVEKWPGLDVAPPVISFSGGMKAYNEGKYDKALKIFSLHGTAYPDDIRRAEYMMACTLMLQGRSRAAVILFSRIAEQYPDTSEALESMVALGNMGMTAPKRKAAMSPAVYDSSLDPVGAYDTVLKRRKQEWSAIEHILYAKGYALMKMGRHEEAHKVLLLCMRTYPSSSRMPVYKAMLRENIEHVFKSFYTQEDYAAVVSLYFQSSSQDVAIPSGAATAAMIGRSLYRMGLFEDAVNFLKAARIKASGQDAEEIGKVLDTLDAPAPKSDAACDKTLDEYRALQGAGQSPPPGLAARAADCLYQGRQYGESIPIYDWVLNQPLGPDEKRWALLRLGQAHLKLGREQDAKKAFDALKAMGADEFWSKLADFAYDDGKWTQKYKQASRKK